MPKEIKTVKETRFVGADGETYAKENEARESIFRKDAGLLFDSVSCYGKMSEDDFFSLLTSRERRKKLENLIEESKILVGL